MRNKDEIREHSAFRIPHSAFEEFLQPECAYGLWVGIGVCRHLTGASRSVREGALRRVSSAIASARCEILNCVGTFGDADAMGHREHVGNRIALRRHELIAGKLEQLAVRIAEVYRVHEAAVDLACVPDAPIVQALSYLGVYRPRNGKGDMVEVADPLRVRCGVIYSRWPHEKGDQPAVARIEVDVLFPRHVQVRLVEHQRHPQHSPGRSR